MKRYFIISIALLTTCMSPQAQAQKSLLKMEDVWASRQFFAFGLPEVRSMKDGKHYTEPVETPNGTAIVKMELSTGNTVDTLFYPGSLIVNHKTADFSDYQLSEDEKIIILSTDVERIYRHSTKANHYVYTIANRDVKPVSESGKQQYATFSPTGTSVAFVRDNNIYLHDLSTGTEKPITTDGKRNEIINGATDWVYEEEFSFDQGYQWSPDGRYLAYYRFDESRVREFNLTYYGELYPKEEKYKYPKAGEDNSIVEIYIYDIAAGRAVKADVNKEADQYIPRILWTANPGKLCVMRMNRLQNKLELYACNAQTGASSLFYTEVNAAYIEISDDLKFLANKKEFIWTSTSDGYNHVYLYDLNGKLIRQITKGKWDVTSVYGYDEVKKTLYYQAAVKSPMEKGVFASSEKGTRVELQPAPGTNSARFTTGFQYYFITNSALDRVPVVTLYDIRGKKIRTIKDNKEVTEAMDKFTLKKPEFFSITTSENVSLNGWMIKPFDFDPSKKYPVIQYMYGGPNSQTVKDEWIGPNYFWFQLLSQQGYIIVSVDNRGTGARGEAFNKCTYKQLGKLETMDQIEVAQWLGKQPFVDASRIGAWGWSYGGYMTSLLMTKGADFFKAAIAVAPVTNWRYYDTIYTERYLQTPQLNPSGYDDNSPINFSKLLKGNFLLIHGTTDDNVHMQNSMEFITSLVKEKKQFDTFLYPNKAHGISGVRLHLYQMMTDWFVANL